MSRELLSRAWSAGAGPGPGPLTIDLDSTICETYGLAKERARHHGYTGQRGYHPLLAVAAGTGDVLMARLREGRANTARGAAHFLRETVGRVRCAGARGQLTVRADSGFYTHALVSACRKLDVRFSFTIRQHTSLRNLIEAIPEADWTPITYWMDGAANVAETTYTPFQSEPGAAPVRLIVRPVKPSPGSQLALFANYSYHGFITGREGDTLELEAGHRRHAEIENAIRDLKYGVGLNHLPSGRFAANAAWLAVQVLAQTDARCPAGQVVGEHLATTKTLRRRFFSLAGRPARRLTRRHAASPARHAASPCTSPAVGPGVSRPLASSPGCAPCHSLPDGVVGSRHASDIILTRQPIKRLPNSCQMGQRAFPAASGPSMSSSPRPPTAATGPVCPKSVPTIASPCPSPPFPVPPQRGSVDSGLRWPTLQPAQAPMRPSARAIEMFRTLT